MNTGRISNFVHIKEKLGYVSTVGNLSLNRDEAEGEIETLILIGILHSRPRDDCQDSSRLLRLPRSVEIYKACSDSHGLLRLFQHIKNDPWSRILSLKTPRPSTPFTMMFSSTLLAICLCCLVTDLASYDWLKIKEAYWFDKMAVIKFLVFYEDVVFVGSITI